jgi:hypothetical protein
MTWEGGEVILYSIFVGPRFDAAAITHRHQPAFHQGAFGAALTIKVQAGAVVVFADAVIVHACNTGHGQTAKAAADAFVGIFQPIVRQNPL